MYRILLCVVALFCCVSGVFWAYLRSVIPKRDGALRTIFKLVLFSQIASIFLAVVNLLVGSSAVTWTDAESLCVFFGFATTVLDSGAVWVLMVAALERYFRFLLPGDHPLTFSSRNIKLLVTGVYIFVCIVATGPLYGLGEYTHFRGYVTGSIKANITSPSPYMIYPVTDGAGSVPTDQSSLILHVFNAIQTNTNLQNAFMGELSHRYETYMNIKQPFGTNPEFIIRSTNSTQLDHLLEDVQNGNMNDIINRFLLIPEINFALENKNTYLYMDISKLSIKDYKKFYIHAQNINHCSVDYGSAMVHASVWSYYQLVINVACPYAAMTILYLIILWRNPNAIRTTDKYLREEDLVSLKTLSFASCCSFLISLTYYILVIFSTKGVVIQSDVQFFITFVKCVSGGTFVIALVLFESKCKTNIKKCLSFDLFHSKPNLCVKLSQLEIMNVQFGAPSSDTSVVM